MQNPSFGDISHRILWILSCWTVILHGSVPNEKSRQKRIEKVKTCENQIYDSKWLGGPNDIPNRFCQKKRRKPVPELRLDCRTWGWMLLFLWVGTSQIINICNMQCWIWNLLLTYGTTVFLSLTTWDPSITIASAWSGLLVSSRTRHCCLLCC